MPREVLVKPLGLVTRPNLYGQYPVGGLSQAQNCVMRAPGILESAPATVLGVSFGASNDVVHSLTPVTGAMISVALSGATWTVRRDTASYSNPANLATTPTYSAVGGISAFQARGRVFINSAESGLLVIDDPTAAGTLRSAGMPQALISIDSLLNDGGAALPLGKVCGYSAVFRRKFSDGYEIVSEPAPIYQEYSIGITTTTNVTLTVVCESNMGLAAGDIVELYKTNVITGHAINASQSDTDPGVTLQLIDTATLVGGDLAAGFVVMRDQTQQGPLGTVAGQALYTNPGQEGLLGANKRPPLCKRMAIFKGFAFYGNITDLPQLKFNIPAGLAAANPANPAFDTVNWRTYGIGVRHVDGTVTIGTNTVTGISATHILGLKIGQTISGGYGGSSWPAGTTITVVGATSVTTSANATASGTGFDAFDRIELDGVPIEMGFNPRDFLFRYASFIGGGGGTRGRYQINTSETLLAGQDPATGLPKIDYFISPAKPNRPTSTNVMVVRATNGASYDPPITEWNVGTQTITSTARPSVIRWSKDSQPEHVPVPNEDFVGIGEIIAFEATRDALWIFCTDGLFRLSGDGGQWRVDTVDTTCVLASPRASCVLRETVYAYTNQGFVRITDAGVEQLSERIIGDLLPGAEYTETASIILERNETEDEIVIRLDVTQVYIYSTRENSYTTVLVPDITAMAYARYPVSGGPALAFGRSPSGSAPRYELWNSTANWLAPTARFQPVFAGDPFTAKQWIDASFVFDVGSIGKSLTPAWNATTSPATLLKGGGQYVNESRAIFGVPRRAAIGNTLTPGFSFAALASATKLYALSLRYRQFGEQQLHR